MSTVIIDGVTVSATVTISTLPQVDQTPTPTPGPTPTPTPTPENGTLYQKSDFPAWGPGGSPNTCGAPRINNAGEVSIKFNTADLFAPGQNVGNFSVYESSQLALCIADSPFVFYPVSGLNCSIQALSGKDGIKFAANDHPATDQQLAASGYKRLVPGAVLYVNFKPLNGEPLSFTPLFGY